MAARVAATAITAVSNLDVGAPSALKLFLEIYTAYRIKSVPKIMKNGTTCMGCCCSQPRIKGGRDCLLGGPSLLKKQILICRMQ